MNIIKLENDESDMVTELNDDWLHCFDKVDELYKDFYKDNVYYVDIKILYVNRQNEIEKIKGSPFLMSRPNCICREEMLEILKKCSLEDNRKYSILSILRYNILLEPDEVKQYLHTPSDRNYLNIIKNIDAVYFEKTISMFQDLNDIILIFYEKSNELKETDPNNCTKRIYFNSLNCKKKTIKKRYKD
jgi:hypothetical protein